MLALARTALFFTPVDQHLCVRIHALCLHACIRMLINSINQSVHGTIFFSLLHLSANRGSMLTSIFQL